MPFSLPKGKPEFSKLEESILQYWKENKTFEKSVESRSAENPYRFYDGPPFITGTPHYGTLMSSIIKDLIPRYQTMLGKRVERVWGWDCHGLPIEQKVQKKLGLESNKEIEESAGGIQGFIDECYAYTRDTSAEWSWYIDHIGRWVDMDNAYRTMDQNYMESVMWVFKQIWEKGYIYEGKRVSWYSWKLSTPISNFEIAMDDSYQDVQDPAITVKFPLTQDTSEQNEVQGGKFEYTDDGYLRYVLAVVRNAEGEILMLQNKKHGDRWQCPGGKIDAGETAEDALKREIKEELGVDIEIVSHLGNRKIMTEKTLWQGEYFETKLTGNPVIQEPEKHAQMQWMKIVEDAEIMHGYYLQYGEHVVTEHLNQMYDAIALRCMQKGLPELKHISALAWTTTPWTIPMHMALAVHRDLNYVFVQSGEEGFLVAKNRLETVFKGKEYTIITDYLGSFIEGKRYNPPFDYYAQKIDERNFRVYHADFVTDTDGTGIAHEAPEFGDVDFQLAKAEGIHITNAIDEAGKYTAEIPDYQGQLYLDCIDPITERLKTEGKLFKKEGITHRVPYCPRSNTPLMQKAQKSWFIDIQRIKSELIAQNESINWFPDHFKHGRFLKSLESAPDWCISRSRFWGTPMPVWNGYDKNGDVKNTKVFASRQEIEEASGQKIVDLHRPKIDNITWEENGLTYKRIPEVLDVWMDSASMPYAQVHYPFENQAKMEASFPADFIAEYTGQIRAWFYVMHAIGVMVKGSPAFKNVAVTGVINGTDGRKMSKSYGNYPDPRETIEKYGADAIRFYLMGGTLMKGEDMTFSEAGIQESIKRVLLPLWNSYTFFATYANIDGWEFSDYSTPKTHELDTWIISRLHTLIQDTRISMDAYDLQKTCDAIMVFLDGLNNWYIRRNRRRFWRSELDADKKSAYETLHEVLVTMTKLLAPICPFITEHLYQNLMNTTDSVHLTDFPAVNKQLINLDVNQKMTDLQNLTNLGLAIRGREKLRVRQPLRAATITLPLDDSARETLAEELNVKEIHIVKDVSDYVTITYSPDAKKIGSTERKQWMKTIIADAKAGKGTLTHEGTLELTVSEAPGGKVILAADEFEAVYTPKEGSTIAFAGSAGYVIGLDTTLDEALTFEGYARDMIRAIQDARKELGFQVMDRLQLELMSDNDMLGKILAVHQGMIEKETLTTIKLCTSNLENAKEVEIDEEFTIHLVLQK